MILDPVRGLLGMDFETASAANLKLVGAWPYSRHSSTRLHVACFSYAESADGPRTRFHVNFEASRLPQVLANYFVSGGAVVVHNASFEKSIWANVLQRFQGWPAIDASQWHDTQALALACNLPMALEGVAKAVGCPTQKDAEGHALMLEMSSAVATEDGTGWIYDDCPTRHKRLAEYCAADVEATLDCFFRLPRLSSMEARIWAADSAINSRGVWLDQDYAARCLRMVNRRKKELSDNAWRDTLGELDNSASTPRFKTWLKANGVALRTVRKKSKATGLYYMSETADKAALDAMLDDGSLPAHVRVVIENRSEANKATSLAKLHRVKSMVDTDGRLRFALQYCGANTGRWTSYGLQLHNLPKLKFKKPLASLVSHFIDCESLDGMHLVGVRPLDGISQLLRGVVASPPGFDLIGGDYSAIEARIVAWLAGQDDVMTLFRQGTDVYVYAANNVGSDDRQLGKVCTLALGYGMGAVKLISTAAGYGVFLVPKRAAGITKLWRTANAAIVKLWGDLESAALDAIAHPGRTIPCGKLACWVKDHCLFIRLPSGRTLRYWRPQVVTVEKTFKMIDDDGHVVEKTRVGDEIQFFAMSKDRSSMAREFTYGGKLVENVTQGIARDIMGEALGRFHSLEQSKPYRVVVHVHDSAVSEVPSGTGDVGEFCRIMAHNPTWAADCPLAVDGYRNQRFLG